MNGIDTAPGHGQPGKCILVVEDDPTIRRMCAIWLARGGFQVDEADNGQVGLEATQKNLYDLVVTDNNMPGLSGLQMVARMRAARRDIPVVMASGTITAADLGQHTSLKISAAVPKPYSAEQMVGTIRQILASQPVAATHPGTFATVFSPASASELISPRWGINE
jgi:CheY-like chemotaxis protein